MCTMKIWEYLKTKKLTIEMLGKMLNHFHIINLDIEYGGDTQLNWKSSITTWNSLQILMKSNNDALVSPI